MRPWFQIPDQIGRFNRFNRELDFNPVRLLVKTENERKTRQTVQTVDSTSTKSFFKLKKKKKKKKTNL